MRTKKPKFKKDYCYICMEMFLDGAGIEEHHKKFHGEFNVTKHDKLDRPVVDSDLLFNKLVAMSRKGQGVENLSHGRPHKVVRRPARKKAHGG